MSQTVGGLGNVFIASGQSQGWIVTWNNSGWQGNTVLEPEPFNTGASLSFTEGSVSRNSNGNYSFTVTIHDNGPNNTFYSLQVSNN